MARSSNPSVMFFLGSVGLGAALMYFYDPQSGRRRRAIAQDQYRHTMRKLEEAQRVIGRDARNRAQGFAAEAKRLVHRDPARGDDVIIAERVRSAIGRQVSHPAAIEVSADGGTVNLKGAVLASEVEGLLECVSCVRGVKGVENHLSVHDEPGNIPALQGGSLKPGYRAEFLQRSWSPAARSVAGGAGALLALVGVFRGGIKGLALGAIGSALCARAATNLDMRSLVGVGSNCTGVTIHKTIHIDAPVERVFEYWANFENFPQWMSHVRSVRDEGDQRYRWVVDGPAGVPVEWKSEMTDVVENRQMGWRSLPGSMVDHSGRVLFEEDPAGGTRVQVELCYVPVAGALGHAVAKAFGADPKSEMDADLMRLKSRIETGVSAHDAVARRATISEATPPPGASRH